jgi:hypothetical protein
VRRSASRADLYCWTPCAATFAIAKSTARTKLSSFDLQDVRDADILLVNYSKASIGTSMEVFYASHNLGKFVIAFGPHEFKDMSPWMVRFCTKILPSVEDAMDYIERHF